MCRKITAILLSALFIFCLTAAAPASTKSETFKDKVNALKLEPLKPSYWSSAFIKRVEASVKDKETNYDKLVAVYDYIRTNATDKKLLDGNPFAYTTQLQCAFEVIGFRTYNIMGKWAAKDDWSLTWVGIDIGSNLYYFDAALPALQKVDVNKAFGISYKKSTLYKEASIVQREIEPTITKGGNMSWALSGTDGIPNSVSKRKPYRSVPDKCHPPSLYYAAGNGYWLMTDDTVTPILNTDKNGVQYIFYPDGTRITYEELRANLKSEAAAEQEKKQAERKKQIEEERDSKPREIVYGHRHRNPDGTYGPWHEGKREDCTEAA